MAENTATKSPPVTRGFVLRVLVKAVVLFAIFNVVYYLVQPLNILDHVSVYNVLVPGRVRMPFADFPADSYNISVLRLDEMLSTHAIAAPKASDEYRVVMIGDSSIWGYLLGPNDTQAACMNRMNLSLPSGRKVNVYNLGYPVLTVTKDMLILRHALAYHPDLILWPTTLASLYPSDQLDFPIIKTHYDEVTALTAQYQFRFYQTLTPPTWWDKTFFGQRQALANWLREQLYGLGWAATDQDHAIARFVQPHPTSYAPDDGLVTVEIMHLAKPPHTLSAEDLSFDVVQAGIDTAGAQNIPVLLINEPMYRSNNDLRYNFYYPKWAYDDYRAAFRDTAASKGWNYVDFWDAVPNEQFTDTDFHMTPAGNCAYAQKISEAMMKVAEK